jgi:arsenate reductase-like glutaredoxin family protein
LNCFVLQKYSAAAIFFLYGNKNVPSAEILRGRYHQQAHNWVEKVYSKVSLRLGSLEDIMKVGSDVMKFNMNSRAEPYRELDKLFELRHQRVRLT